MNIASQVDTLRDMAAPDKQAALDQCLVDRAADLARKGDGAQAGELLRPLLERVDPPTAALDLMARICARQGKLAEAETLWTRLLPNAGAHAEASACLAEIRKAQRIALRLLHPLIKTAAATAALLMAGGFAWGMITLAVTNKTLKEQSRQLAQVRQETALGAQQQAAALETMSQTGAGILRRQGTQEKALAAASRQIDNIQTILSTPATPPPLNFTSAGASMEAAEKSWVVKLNASAFDKNGRLLPSVRNILKDLTKAVAVSDKSWRIEIITFPYPRETDAGLARERAARIASYIEETCHLSGIELYTRIGSERESQCFTQGSPWRDPSRQLFLRLSETK